MTLSLNNKIGQLFFVGLSGTEITDSVKAFLNEVNPGGICLFSRNLKTAEQTRNFINQISEETTPNLLISIDQEGGLVDRLRRIISPMPAASSISTTSEVGNLAEITSEILRMLGFNMNFAPVVDISCESEDRISNGLYSRTFGNSKEQVTKLAGAYLEKLQDDGCLGCLKHFPGLGASRTDSHEELPIVDISTDFLISNELFPYQELIKNNFVHAVMVAHSCFPQSDLQETDQDGKLLPSSLSFNFVTKLLRNQLNFNGLIISDDLEMGAILKNYSIGEACVMAINAGVDMISICADPNNILEGFKAVKNAVVTGEISESRIEQSLKRIEIIKEKIQPPLPLDESRLKELSNQIAELNKKLNTVTEVK